MTCPRCQGPLTTVGAFRVCPVHGPAAEPAPQPVASRQVFISYGRADGLEFAQRLRSDLEARGHDAWFDLTSIEQGGLFEVRIEQKIRSAYVVAAVMTPYSVRAESICRDEVVFALNEGKCVVPLRAHPDVRPTLLLARRNWIDFTGDYADALATLLRFLDGDESALAPAVLPSVTGVEPLDFGPEIARYSLGFTGRAWLGDAISAWLGDERAGVLVLVGEPGVGKSAIAAWLCLTRPEVVGIHFCTHRSSRSLDPHELVASLVAQLHARLPGYAERVERRRPEQRRARAADAFRELVVEPGRELDPGRKLVVVDSLDEAAVRPTETIVDVLAEQASDLPPWLKIVGTTRPESNVLDRIRALRTLPLAADSRGNLEDLGAYCRSRLRGRQAESLVPRVEALAQGNFLYARMAIDALDSGALGAGELGQLSPGLADFFGFAFRSRFPDSEAFRRSHALLLSVLVAAQGPLTAGLLARATGHEPERVHRVLRELRTHLRPAGEGEEQAWSLFHSSLRDWLGNPETAGDYWCPGQRGHERLAEALAGVWETDPYALRHLPAHLLAAGRHEALVALLTRLDFVERRCAAGMTYDLVFDYQAAGLGTHRDPDCALVQFGRFVQRRAHVLAVRPDRVRVEAALEPEGSAPCREARAGTGPAGPWLDWSNRPRAQDACVMTLRGHAGAVTACAFAPDGARLLTASEDRTLRVWDARTGVALLVLRTERPVLAAAWMPDGNRIVSTFSNGAVRVWDAHDGSSLAGWFAHDRAATACAVSPDGRHVVTGSKDCSLRVWDAATTEPRARLVAHQHAVTCCAFSGDGRRLVSGADHHRIAVWDAAGYSLLEGISGHHRCVTALAFAPDSRRFASASEDRTLVVWDAASLEAIATLSGHRDAVRAVAWSPDGARIVSTSADQTLRLWDPSGPELASLTSHTVLSAVAVSGDGRWIASASKDGTVRLWDAAAALRSERPNSHAAAIDACAVSPDGRRLVTASRDRSLAIWETGTGSPVARLQGHEEAVLDCAWSPDGTRVLSVSLDNTARTWDATTFVEQRVLTRILGTGPAGDLVGLTCCAFSPDGRRVVGGSGDRVLGVREVLTARLMARYGGHLSGVLGCAFSPDGRLVASASWDGTVRVWDAATGDERHVFGGHESGVRACHFSPDGQRLASAGHDGTLRLWDVLSGQPLGVVVRLQAALRACTFLPNGAWIAAACDDCSVRVFTVRAREEAATFFGEAPVHCVAYAPGGLLVAGDAVGQPLLLRLRGFDVTPAIVTPVRQFLLEERRWDDIVTIRCPLCGGRSESPRKVLDVPCPICGGALRLNPFVVDDRAGH